jgi:carboxylesterase type B
LAAAKGLFHRAIIQSTLWDTAITATEIPDATMAAEMFLSRVGVKPGEIDKLQAMPSERLIEALTASGDISTK